ncbi:MAG: dTDP-4-dehydrorhamnose 3,5-epimerase family protein, partial [Firmicutes bacterium]|nr:dTDP-4-dehydrorhamnose 3,5-epimerase family protein [Bacillota bacterium]
TNARQVDGQRSNFATLSMLSVSITDSQLAAAFHIVGPYIISPDYHKKQWDHFVCVAGMAKVVLYDQREDSPTRGKVNEFHMGRLNPILVKIPPHVYHGFTAEGPETALIVNFPTELYNYAEPDEFRLAYNDPSIPYSWEIRHG